MSQFKLDLLNATRNTSGSYTISGMYNYSNATEKEITSSIRPDETDIVFEIDSTFDPAADKLVIKEFEFNFDDLHSAARDLFEITLLHKAEKAIRVEAHLEINDTKYPPPPCNSREDADSPRDGLSDLFTITQLNVERMESGFRLIIDTEFSGETEYVSGGIFVEQDQYNQCEYGDPNLYTIVCYVTEGSNPGKTIRFEIEEIDLKRYSMPGIAVVIAKDPIDWTKITGKKCMLSIR